MSDSIHHAQPSGAVGPKQHDIIKEEIAQQVSAKDRLIEQLEEAFNPASAQRAQSRLNRFKTLEERAQTLKKQAEEGQLIQQIQPRTQEDLGTSSQLLKEELSQESLESLLQTLPQEGSVEQILEHVLKFFKDPFLANSAFEYLRRMTQGDLKLKIDQAKELLEQRFTTELKAATNINPAANNFATQLQTAPSQLRELYYLLSKEQKEHNELFIYLSKHYSFEQLKPIIHFLLKAVGYDLKAKGPSIEPSLLMKLLKEARMLQSILWIYLFFKDRQSMIEKLYAQHQLTYPQELNFEALAQRYIDIVEEKYPSKTKLLNLLSHLSSQPQAQEILLTQFRDAIRSTSLKIYRSLKHRQDLLLLILEVLEDLDEELS